jgi:WD40 repeat protein
LRYSDHRKLQRLVWHPNGNQLAIPGTKDVPILARGGKWGVETKLIGHSDPVSILAYSPNGKYIASASNDIINIWELEGKKEKGDKGPPIIAYAPVDKTDTITALVWHPTENALFFHLHSGFIKKW